jgi:hypothetical protein
LIQFVKNLMPYYVLLSVEGEKNDVEKYGTFLFVNPFKFVVFTHWHIKKQPIIFVDGADFRLE